MQSKAELAGYRTNWVTDEIKLAPNGCVVADALMKCRPTGGKALFDRKTVS
jgi:hypothetical protein